MPTTLLSAGKEEPKAPASTLAQLLAEVPLNSERYVAKAFDPKFTQTFLWPEEYRDYCNSDQCAGVRRFTKINEGHYFDYRFGSYHCANCRRFARTICVRVWRPINLSEDATVAKVYQEPAFGPPIPKGLFDLIGEDNRDAFLQARRSIARGLGVGAYAYYRRIIENNKLALISAILAVAKRVAADAPQIALLEKAAGERQFTRAIDMVRDAAAIPPVLLINGHNPLLLLHDELSEGVHAMTDAECLERAQHAETILIELARLMQLAVAERKEINEALAAVLKRKQKTSAAENGAPVRN